MQKGCKKYFLFTQSKILFNTVSVKTTLIFYWYWRKTCKHQIDIPVCIRILNTNLGPAEKGKKAKESLFSEFSLLNLSGLNSMWSSPHTAGLWCSAKRLMMITLPWGMLYSSTLIGWLFTLEIPGTGECILIPSLMHIVRYSNFPKSLLYCKTVRKLEVHVINSMIRIKVLVKFFVEYLAQNS